MNDKNFDFLMTCLQQCLDSVTQIQTALQCQKQVLEIGDRKSPRPDTNGYEFGVNKRYGEFAAQRANGVVLADAQNRLLASIETRLTDEMGRLALALREFAHSSQVISKEIPESANFCKLVTGFFSLFALQFADALQRSGERLTFEDDGALYLRELGLQLNDFIREVDLEGRKFLAVALTDKDGNSIFERTNQGHGL